jgi:hypothetical protein
MTKSAAALRAILGILCFAACGMLHAGESSAKAALVREIESLRGMKMGVDAQNCLWAWNAGTTVVTRLSPTGDRYESGPVGPATSVDADSSRGILTLGDAGNLVRVVDWTGMVQREIQLTSKVAELAWGRGEEVLVTPRFADRRVEVWNAKTGAFVRAIGPCDEIKIPATGAVAARATHVRFDPVRREIVTFDAYYGDLVVFREDGTPVRSTRVVHPKMGEVEGWLIQIGAEARAKGKKALTPLVWRYATLTTDAQGSIVLGEEWKDDGSVTLVKVARDGSVVRIPIKFKACPSVRVVAWQDDLIFFRDPKSPQPCTGVRRNK